MDDILIFGKDQTEHDQRLEAVLRRIEKAGVTLNPQKCEFSKNKLTFLGHVIDATVSQQTQRRQKQSWR